MPSSTVLPAFVLTLGVRDFDLKANIVRLGLNYQCPYHKKNFQIRKIENAAAAKTVYHLRVIRPALLKRGAGGDAQYDDEGCRRYAEPFCSDGNCGKRGPVNAKRCSGDSQYLGSCLRSRPRQKYKYQNGENVQQN